MAKRDRLEAAEMKLRGHALRFPEVTEDFPWEHRALKVKGKVFLFLYREPALLSLSVKLPESAQAALRLPFAAPTGYGLGKSGWVTAKFEQGDKIPVDMLLEWISESYRAIAPKRVLAQLDGGQLKARRKETRSQRSTVEVRRRKG
jgi:predicted DNA-binding protein (MmcQ/YjbR family)